MNNSQYKTSIAKDELELLPIQSFEGQIVLVNWDADIKKALRVLKQSPIVGFDTETRPSFKKGRKNKVALLQLSTPDIAFIFRLTKSGLTNDLAEFLSNPAIIKAGVAIKDDIIALQQLAPFNPGGFVEIQDEVKLLNIENFGLKPLAGLLLGFRISKAQQTSNWEADELTEAQLKYAATDAWVSLKIYEKLVTLKPCAH